jgi:hypothetical protein
MKNKHPKRHRRNRTHKPLPAKVYCQSDRREGFNYESLLAEVPFDEAAVDLLESRASRAVLKPKPRGLNLRPVAAQPFANLGTKTIGDESHEKLHE